MLDWMEKQLKDMDLRTRKLFGVLPMRSSVDRNVYEKERGGLISVRECGRGVEIPLSMLWLVKNGC